MPSILTAGLPGWGMAVPVTDLPFTGGGTTGSSVSFAAGSVSVSVVRSDIPVVNPGYSCSLRKIDMVKAVDGWEFNNVAGFRYSYWTTVRRIAVQGLECSPRMVVIQIRRHKSLEMPLVEHDDMVEKFSA